ncbi:MAG: DUF433 domain-containing protein [Bryobacteraceae bacterium]|nr:DUF433 domain-containing protein [Bryobacterales bacterium]NUN03933.1 DUF433 domain-containing protein [Bryobacteraceae bacterium]
MDYKRIIAIDPGRMGGKPCIRGMRITVYDALDYFGLSRSPHYVTVDPLIFFSCIPDSSGAKILISMVVSFTYSFTFRFWHFA